MKSIPIVLAALLLSVSAVSAQPENELTDAAHPTLEELYQSADAMRVKSVVNDHNRRRCWVEVDKDGVSYASPPVRTWEHTFRYMPVEHCISGYQARKLLNLMAKR